MFDIEVVQWRGNKDVPLIQTMLPSVPRMEDYLEFQVGAKPVRGKVTRVTYKVHTDPANATNQRTSIHVRINTNA